MVASVVAAATPTLVVELGNQTSPSHDTVAIADGLWSGLFVIGSLRLAGVFMITTSTLGQRFGALPRWLSLLGVALALVVLVKDPFSLLFPAWLVIVTTSLVVSHHRSISRATPASGDQRAATR